MNTNKPALTMTISQFRECYRKGAVSKTGLRAFGNDFVIVADSSYLGGIVLVTQKEKTPRRFSDPKRAMKILREIGVTEIHVDMVMLGVIK